MLILFKYSLNVNFLFSDNLHVCINVHSQRPTAQELLKHKFLKQAKKTSYLVDLVDRYKRWKASGGEDTHSPPESRHSRRSSDGGQER